MGWIVDYLRSSLGKKQVMAVTGLMLALFVFVHMLSHLLMFSGADAYNGYAHDMQSLGPLLWVLRGGLLSVFLVHVIVAIGLILANKRARPVSYKRFVPVRSRFYSRAMAFTGLLLLAFVVMHLLHFTTGDLWSDFYGHVDGKGRHDVHRMMVLSFQKPLLVGLYLGALAFLCMHLAHGMSSWFQSLGLNHRKYNSIIRVVGPVYGVSVFAGYVAVPLAILAGVIKL